MGRKNLQHRLDNLPQKTEAVFHAAAVNILATVGFRLQKLVDQIAVGRVNLDTVKTGLFRPLRRPAVIFDDGGYFIDTQGAWSFIGLLSKGSMNHVAFQFDGGRRDRQIAIMETAMGCPPAMPKLHENGRALGMNRSDDLPPSQRLRVGVNPWAIRPAYALFGHHRGFADNQASRGALGVVLGHQRVGQTLFTGARAGHGRHRHAVFERQIAQLERIKQHNQPQHTEQTNSPPLTMTASDTPQPAAWPRLTRLALSYHPCAACGRVRPPKSLALNEAFSSPRTILLGR